MKVISCIWCKPGVGILLSYFKRRIGGFVLSKFPKCHVIFKRFKWIQTGTSKISSACQLPACSAVFVNPIGHLFKRSGSQILLQMWSFIFRTAWLEYQFQLFLSEHLLFNKITVFRRQKLFLTMKLLPFDEKNCWCISKKYPSPHEEQSHYFF